MRKLVIILLPIIICVSIIVIKLNLNSILRFIPVCPFYTATGLYCTGCGSTRAVISLLNMDLISAIKYNLGLVSSLIVILISYIEYALNKKILPRKFKFWIVFLAIIISYYIVRNLIYLF